MKFKKYIKESTPVSFKDFSIGLRKMINKFDKELDAIEPGRETDKLITLFNQILDETWVEGIHYGVDSERDKYGYVRK